MKEQKFLEIIKQNLSDSSYIGDDCALIKEKKEKQEKQESQSDLCITQDTLVEDIHFSLKTTTACELAQKAVNVNFSDLAAAGAEPLFITISLSLPKSADESFVNEFYKGVQTAISKYNAKVIGGDLTASEKVFISICAIGRKYNDISISRANAKAGDIIAVTGVHGDSAGGLKLLQNGIQNPQKLIKKHLLPEPQTEKSKILMQTAKQCGLTEFAMMDSSDGLADALYQMSKAGNLAFDIDYDSIPVSKELKETFPQQWQNMMLWGGEDFELVFAIDEKAFNNLDKTMFHKIGTVSDRPFDKEKTKEYEKNVFKHFEENTN